MSRTLFNPRPVARSIDIAPHVAADLGHERARPRVRIADRLLLLAALAIALTAFERALPLGEIETADPMGGFLLAAGDGALGLAALALRVAAVACVTLVLLRWALGQPITRFLKS